MTSKESSSTSNDSITTDEVFYRKPLFEMQPGDNAPKDEWRDWAISLRKWAMKISKSEKNRKRQLKKLRRELNIKNKVFIHYKKKIEKLENKLGYTYEDLEADEELSVTDWLIQIKLLFYRIRSALKGKIT